MPTREQEQVEGTFNRFKSTFMEIFAKQGDIPKSEAQDSESEIHAKADEK